MTAAPFQDTLNVDTMSDYERVINSFGAMGGSMYPIIVSYNLLKYRDLF
jgi:hypothetical protein